MYRLQGNTGDNDLKLKYKEQDGNFSKEYTNRVMALWGAFTLHGDDDIEVAHEFEVCCAASEGRAGEVQAAGFLWDI